MVAASTTFMEVRQLGGWPVTNVLELFDKSDEMPGYI